MIKLIEDSESTVRDIDKTLKHFRNHFGRKFVAPHLRDILQKHLSKLEEHHSVEEKKFKDKHGNDMFSTLAKVKDLKQFVSLIAGIRDIKKPKLTLGLDGNTNQLVISGIITDSEASDKEENKSDFNPGRIKRVLMLAKADGVPEIYNNVKILPCTGVALGNNSFVLNLLEIGRNGKKCLE